MNFDLLYLLEKMVWAGIAALGFSILFNIPRRTLWAVFILGSLAGFIKYYSLENGVGIVLSCLMAASAVGFLSILFAQKKHTTPFVMSIPAVIPMIPGYYGYKTLIGLVSIAIHATSVDMKTVLISVVQNGLFSIFILVSLALGVSLPWLIFRTKVLKRIKFQEKESWL